MKAGHLLGICAAFQLVVVCINIFSPLIYLMVPLSVSACIFLAAAVYFKWKRGVEAFIGLSIAIIVVVLIPFCKILVDQSVKAKAYEFSCYCLELFAEGAAVVVAVWVLYHTDYSAPPPEQKPLMERLSRTLSGGITRTSTSSA
jgi:hypothetical protein